MRVEHGDIALSLKFLLQDILWLFLRRLFVDLDNLLARDVNEITIFLRFLLFFAVL